MSGSWDPTGSVLNFEGMRYAFFLFKSGSRIAYLKLLWCQQRVPPRITGFKSSSKKDATSRNRGTSERCLGTHKFPDFSILASMFHVNLCGGSWGPTGSVLNFEGVKYGFFRFNSVSRIAHLKFFWRGQRSTNPNRGIAGPGAVWELT